MVANRSALFLLAFSAVQLSTHAFAQLPQPDGGAVQPGHLPASWVTGGPNCLEMQDWEVHQFNPDFFILRESGCTNYEKPFLYLIFGKERALLLDTGAGPAQTYDAVYRVVNRWLEKNGRTSIPLVVTHSHGHGDHIEGDGQFRGKPGVQFVEPTVAGAKEAFAIKSWPDTNGIIDLGSRPIDIIPIPGHQEASIALYDRLTGILLTGDSLYPGRLYVNDWPAFKSSIQRLVSFTEGKTVTYILGCHIEEARQPYLDYKVGTKYQPEEHSLDLGRGELLELNAALQKMGSTPARAAFRDFTIWPKEHK